MRIPENKTISVAKQTANSEAAVEKGNRFS